MTFIAGDMGLSGKAVERALPVLPGARCVTLKGYAAPIWADCVSDNTEKFVKALCDLPGRLPKVLPDHLKAAIPASPIGSRGKARPWSFFLCFYRPLSGAPRCQR